MRSCKPYLQVVLPYGTQLSHILVTTDRHPDDPVVRRLAGAGTMVGQRNAQVAQASPAQGDTSPRTMNMRGCDQSMQLRRALRDCT